MSKSYPILLLFGFISLLFAGLPSAVNAATVDDFIPIDSLVYLKLQDLDEVYNEITTSETWKMTIDQTIDQLMGESDLKEMKNSLLALQSIIGTDVYGVIDTIGYQTGLALWVNNTKTVDGGMVIHSGGNLKELQRLTKVVSGTLGLSGGILTLDAGQYRKVKYNTLKLGDTHLTYGFIGDFLVVGKAKDSFEKLIDTYKKKKQSIKKKDSYVKTSKKLGPGELRISVNATDILPYLDDIGDSLRVQLETFTRIHAKLNLLDASPLLKLHVEFNENHLESRITPFLKEGDELKILNSMSGKEDLFVAAAPGVLGTVWELIQAEIQNAETDDVFTFITFLEDILNLNFEEDIIAALTGEIALSVDDLSLFEPSALESLNLDIGNSIQVDASNVQTRGGLLFIPNNPVKWDQMGNSLSNLQNSSISSFDYKGKRVSIFGSNIYYAESDGVSLLSFSEDQMYSLVDRIAAKKKAKTLKHLPKSPLVFVNLNVIKLLQVFQDIMPVENDAEIQHESFPLFAWITVNDTVAMLEVILSDKESPIEVFSKIVPLVVSRMRF